MATHRELEAQIRFQLDQLTVRNGHHDFEHLCRHLARNRICSNILPATGPVAAGGDQGRDFETYEAFVQDPLEWSVFVGEASNLHLTFACTLQKDGIASKLKSDVKGIMISGGPVDAIYFLCVTDIPVSKRHELQAWASSKYDVSLEIHDGQWISQELCQRDIFWIAQQYLGIPRAMVPDSLLEDDSYRELYHRWEDSRPCSLAELLDASYGLRAATKVDGPSEDLAFWLDRVDPDSVPQHLRRHAIYETALASLRGRKSMEGLEPFIREYFASALELSRLSDLDDASVMLGFCVGASGLQVLDISIDEITGYSQSLTHRIDILLQNVKAPGHRAQLLFIRGQIAACCSSDFDGFESCLDNWEQAANLIENAPLFPLSALAELITKLLELLPEEARGKYQGRLLALASRLDTLTEERYGAFASASACRDRGMVLYRKGDLLGAIEQFHRAKKGWFAEETLQGSILAILFVSKCYQELGLNLAAKYYALAGAFMASTTPNLHLRRYVPQGLFMAADCDYVQGSWCNYMLLAEVGLEAFAQFGIEEDSSVMESDINRTLFHAGIIFAMAQHFAPGLRSSLKRIIEAWDLADDLDVILGSADKAWVDKNREEVEEALRAEGIHAPFSDAGHKRTIRFRALGIEWSVDWENTYLTNAIGEHFTAVLQVILADVAKLDLCLLPKTILVSLELGDAAPTNALVEGPNPGEWLVTLPDAHQTDDFDLCVFASITGILACSSALHMEKMRELIDERLQQALLSKTFCVRSFVDLVAAFLKEDEFLVLERNFELSANANASAGDEHPQLREPSELGPGYDRTEHELHISKRYTELTKRLAGILPDLASRGEFRATASALREDGWKDWHILLATYNAIINYVAKLERGTEDPETATERIAHMREVVSRGLVPDDVPIPDEAVSEGNLRFHLSHSMMATLQTWDLRVNTRRFDASAIEAFLSRRYAYWRDDVEHDDLGF